MEYKTLFSKVLNKLKKMGYKAFAERAEDIDNEEDLKAFLRKNIFPSDKEVLEFIDSVQVVEQKPMPAKKSLTELEINEILLSSLDTLFKKKDSKFKVVKKYLSPDGDLCIQIADENGFESYYRILTLRT